jgi:tight adherence protein B
VNNALFYVAALLLFVAVVLLLEGAFVWWDATRGPQARRIADRLRLLSAGGHAGAVQLSILKQRLYADAPALQRLLLRLPRVQQLDRLLEQSGLHWNVAQLMLGLILAGVVAGALLLGFGMPLPLAVPVALAAALLPLLELLRRRHRRLIRLDLQLPGALDLIAQALRAGHSLPNALSLVGDEMAAPIGPEFAATFDEVNYGFAMKDAMLNLATRVPVPDLRYFVVAVLIQRETGGNLAELLTSIAAIIRGRHKLRGAVRVLAADSKISAWVLCLLPFLVALVIQWANPDFLSVLVTDPLGRQLLLLSGGLMLIGIVWIRNLVRLHV